MMYFVTGMPRSGTTIISNALNKNGCVFVPKETHYFEFLVGGLLARFFEKRRSSIVAGIMRENGIEDFDNCLPAKRVGATYAKVIQKIKEDKNVHLVIEKTPNHYKYLWRHGLLLGSAKVIHLIRDPRDIYLSRQKVPWGGKSPIDIAREYKEAVEAIHKMRGEGLGVLVVKYEDLIQSPKEVIENVCAFVGVNFCEGMVSPGGSDDFDPQVEYWKLKNTTAIDPGNMKKWKKYKDSIWCRYISKCCSIELLENGYEAGLGEVNLLEAGRLYFFFVVGTVRRLLKRLLFKLGV